MIAKREAILEEPGRLAELHALHLLDTPPELSFDRLTRLAARLLRCETALVCLVDDHRQFFKSAIGLPEPWASQRETPLRYSFCKHVVARAAPLVVDDAHQHPVVRHNPAIAALGIVAYLGVPLSTRNGATLGSFCVIDTRARNWTDADQNTMVDLAASVISEIELRSTTRARKALDKPLNEKQLMDVIYSAVHDALADDPSCKIMDLAAYRAVLTKRQREIFDLLVHGLQTKEIARRLDISPRTVEVHRSKILQRVKCPSLSKLLSQLF
jgi:DNA-binding CsgD family transcriptional regulator